MHVVCVLSVHVGMCSELVRHGDLSIGLSAVLLCTVAHPLHQKNHLQWAKWPPPSTVCGRGRAIPCVVCNDS